MKLTIGTSGLEVFFDAADFGLIRQYRWTPRRGGRTFYAAARANGKTIPMHRLIMEAQPGQHIDHKDGNGLNNTRENLRFATPLENARNIGKRRRANATSQYKGVTHPSANGRWRAVIVVLGKNVQLGLYDTEIEAARAYDSKAMEVFGDFARLNFPGETPAPFVMPEPKMSSKYRGVYWSKASSKWSAEFFHEYRKHYLGLFNTEIDAALAYDRKAIEAGTFSKLNFPVRELDDMAKKAMQEAT